MSKVIVITLHNDNFDENATKLLLEKAMDVWLWSPGLDYDIRLGQEGDPLSALIEGSGAAVSDKQLNLLGWKLNILKNQIAAVSKLEVDEAAAQIAVDIFFCARTEYDEHRCGATPMSKKRASELIDAVLEAVGDMEYELSNVKETT